MTKIATIIRLIFINALIFLVLLLIVNWACGLLLKKNAQLKREDLPNYAADPTYAQQVFKDYNSIKHQYEPFVGWKTLPYEGKTLTINNSGNRVHEPPTVKVAPEKIVHFFGGSTMWGEGSDDQNTIAALFNIRMPHYKVHNHAQLAYNTRQELDALISLYSKGEKADLVIFYDGVNDAAFLCPKEIKELPAHRLVPLYRDKLYVGKSKLIKEVVYIMFVENIVKLINRNAKRNENESPYNCLSDPSKAEEIAEILMKNWEMAHEIVTTRGGKFMAVLQPAAFIGKPKTDHLKLDEDLQKNFAEVYKHIKQKIAERKHPWIYDLSNAFDRDEFIYIDFCHVSPNGNQIIADEIVNIFDKHSVLQSTYTSHIMR